MLSTLSSRACSTHELNKARTDFDVEDTIRTGQSGVVGWISKSGEEVDDAPIRTATGL
jgi:hypothetical protein